MLSILRGIDTLRETQQRLATRRRAVTMCWFDKGMSPASSYRKRMVTGLGFLKAINIVHYNHRHQQLDLGRLGRILERYRGVILALEDLSAIEIDADSHRAISASRKARIYRISLRSGNIDAASLTGSMEYGEMSSILPLCPRSPGKAKAGINVPALQGDLRRDRLPGLSVCVYRGAGKHCPGDPRGVRRGRHRNRALALGQVLTGHVLTTQ